MSTMTVAMKKAVADKWDAFLTEFADIYGPKFVTSAMIVADIQVGKFKSVPFEIEFSFQRGKDQVKSLGIALSRAVDEGRPIIRMQDSHTKVNWWRALS